MFEELSRLLLQGSDAAVVGLVGGRETSQTFQGFDIAAGVGGLPVVGALDTGADREYLAGRLLRLAALAGGDELGETLLQVSDTAGVFCREDAPGRWIFRAGCRRLSQNGRREVEAEQRDKSETAHLGILREQVAGPSGQPDAIKRTTSNRLLSLAGRLASMLSPSPCEPSLAGDSGHV
jgi:hypothetical protein